MKPQQIRRILNLIRAVEQGGGDVRSIADRTLVSLAPCLTLEEIEEIIDEELKLLNSLNRDVRGVANKTITILCPYSSAKKIQVVHNSTIAQLEAAKSEFIFAEAELRISALLPHLQRQQVQEVIGATMTLWVDKSGEKTLIRTVALKLLSILLFHMNNKQIKTIAVEGYQDY